MTKILFIEDDTVVRENTAELLELSDYHVTTAANGKQGVELAKNLIPDIIICDIMMPEMDGYGVLENLSKNPDTQQIPFIFLSAKTEHKDIRRGMDLGADDYLTKPFEEEDLINAIESRLAKVAILKKINAEKPKTQPEVEKINDLKKSIRRNLGNRIGKSVRIVPELAFFLDESSAYAQHMDQVLSDLNIPEASEDEEEEKEN